MNYIYHDEIINEIKDKCPINDITGAQLNYLTIRCPYCGDSVKHKDHGHLGIFLFAPVWKCLRCGRKGRVDNLLRDILGRNIILNDIIKEEYKGLISYKSTSKLSKNSYKKSVIDFNSFDLGFNETTNQNKVDYLFNRLNYKRIPDFVTNIIIDDDKYIKSYMKDIYRSREYNVDDDYINKMYNEYLYFIGDRGTFMSGRDITSKNKRKYNILAKEKELDYVTITNPNKKQYSVFNNKIINVCMGEGIFDIINAVSVKRFENIDLFICTMGKNFKNAMMYLNIYFNVFNMNLHLLLDNTDDVDLGYYRYLFNEYNFLLNDIELYSVENKKDFGDYRNGDSIIELKFNDKKYKNNRKVY